MEETVPPATGYIILAAALILLWIVNVRNKPWK